MPMLTTPVMRSPVARARRSAAHLVGEARHPVQHGVDRRA